MLCLRHKLKYLISFLLVALAAAVVVAPPETSATPVSGRIIPAAKTVEKQSVVLDSLYQAALVLLQQKNWYEASIVLERIWLQQPGYRHEKALARHPDRVSLYLKLANLYLLAGRSDQCARTAYAMMRLLHFVSRHREQGNPIAAPG